MCADKCIQIAEGASGPVSLETGTWPRSGLWEMRPGASPGGPPADRKYVVGSHLLHSWISASLPFLQRKARLLSVRPCRLAWRQRCVLRGNKAKHSNAAIPTNPAAMFGRHLPGPIDSSSRNGLLKAHRCISTHPATHIIVTTALAPVKLFFRPAVGLSLLWRGREGVGSCCVAENGRFSVTNAGLQASDYGRWGESVWFCADAACRVFQAHLQVRGSVIRL
jgi:hypothetical protein